MARDYGRAWGKGWSGLAAAVAIVLALAVGSRAGAAAEADSVPPELPIAFGGPFNLVNHEGQARSDRDFLGSFLLIYFGYTYCPDICPTNLQIMSDALDSLGETAEQVQPLFITVDPARDTAEVLRDYVGHFHPRLIGLTGSEAQVREVAKAYRVHRSKVVTAEAEGADDYLVNHSSITFLMGPDGRFLTLFPHDTPAERMADTLRKYLR